VKYYIYICCSGRVSSLHSGTGTGSAHAQGPESGAADPRRLHVYLAEMKTSASILLGSCDAAKLWAILIRGRTRQLWSPSERGCRSPTPGGSPAARAPCRAARGPRAAARRSGSPHRAPALSDSIWRQRGPVKKYRQDVTVATPRLPAALNTAQSTITGALGYGRWHGGLGSRARLLHCRDEQ